MGSVYLVAAGPGGLSKGHRLLRAGRGEGAARWCLLWAGMERGGAGRLVLMGNTDRDPGAGWTLAVHRLPDTKPDLWHKSSNETV